MSKKDSVFAVFNFDVKKYIEDSVDRRELKRELQDVVEDTILPTIDRGLSPVSGHRMFEKYRHPKRYPGVLKPSNKPNLTLRGDMLSFYDVKEIAGDELTFSMGIHRDAPEIERIKGNVHNSGTQTRKQLAAKQKLRDSRGAKQNKKKVLDENILKGSIPARRFIPKKGESYTREIILVLRAAFASVIARSLSRSKK